MKNQSILSQKENWAPLERRLSLKYSSAMQSKNNPRMSIPMRRESIATTTGISPFNDFSNYRDARPSLASISSTQLQKPAKKQTILTNLIRKLDHEEELKEIIHNKIKNGRSKENYSYLEGSESVEFLESKLRGCQEEIECFKDLVRELIDKIANLQRNTSHGQYPVPIKKSSNSNKQFGIQTEANEKRKDTQNVSFEIDNSMDFMDNLNKTLKVLSGKKTR